jgi:hypothetical protein
MGNNKHDNGWWTHELRPLLPELIGHGHCRAFQATKLAVVNRSQKEEAPSELLRPASVEAMGSLEVWR